MQPETFRLPLSSYQQLTKIIIAYGHAGEKVTPKTVGDLTGFHKTLVSRNNAFLSAIGVIQGGKLKTITPLGKKLAGALEYNQMDQIPLTWREVVQTNDFLQKVLAAVKIRKGMDISTLRSHIAYSAGQPKGPGVMAGSGAIVEILKTAELLLDSDGNFTAAPQPSTAQPSDSPPPSSNPASQQSPVQTVQDKTLLIQQTVTSASAPVPVSLNIQVSIQCTPQDIDSLAPRLKALLSSLNTPNPTTHDQAAK